MRQGQMRGLVAAGLITALAAVPRVATADEEAAPAAPAAPAVPAVPAAEEVPARPTTVKVRASSKDLKGGSLLVPAGLGRAAVKCGLPCDADVEPGRKVYIVTTDGSSEEIVVSGSGGDVMVVEATIGASLHDLGVVMATVGGVSVLAGVPLVLLSSMCFGRCDDGQKARQAAGGIAVLAGLALFATGLGLSATSASLDVKTIDPNTVPARRDAHLDDTRLRTPHQAGPPLPGFVQIPVGFSF